MNVLFLLVIAAVIVALVYKNKRYKETAYYQITKKPYWFMDKGTRGEYLIYECLRHLEDVGGKLLFNIYLPKGNNKTTEIDALLISPKGLLVFESKNYSGWIFGNEAHTNWTQTFPLGSGRSHKERFYNPVKQNATHVNHLRRLLGEKIPMWSIIVFSDECTLKNITVKSGNVHVINRHKVASVVAQICGQMRPDVLTGMEINDIYNKLYPYTQVSNEIREQHAKNVQG